MGTVGRTCVIGFVLLSGCLIVTMLMDYGGYTATILDRASLN